MKESFAKRPIRVGLISLGCAKNLVDAEIMLGTLLQGGMEITSDPTQADVMIVNTCSFIDSAQEESVDAILESSQVRAAANRGQGLIVSGCLPQRFREELPKLLPEVDAFMGIDQVTRVTEIVREVLARQGQSSPPEPAAAKPRKSKIVRRLGELDTAGANQPTMAQGNRPAQNGRVDFSAGPSLPGVDMTPLVAVNPRPQYIPNYDTPRFRLTPRHFAYVKIAEGCNHPCSFCTIPRMRGTHRSRSLADILAEARRLIAEGVKELNLISQDSTYYGLDLRPNHSRGISSPEKFTRAVQSLPSEAANICTLLRELNALPGDFWIRLLYTHPAHWTDELIATLAECPKVARYVDIPLQHIHENMLERMRRETTQQYIVDLLRRIRAGVPGIALRTTFIVGFPGETEAYFETLLEFIRATRFERLGVFTYSREEHTIAGKMAGQVPERIKRRRRDLAMAAQHEVAVQVSESFVGRTMKVLVERQANARELEYARFSSWEHGLIRAETGQNAQAASLLNGSTPRPVRQASRKRGVSRAGMSNPVLIARGEADAPDIDGRVYVRGDGLPPGDFAWVKIIGHTDYDLIAEPRRS
jgi:ribosomal protein S12 methylthiotransferase